MARKSDTRSLRWGSAYRNKVENRLGMPHIGEGSDGDIQIRNTSIGTRLFAKFGGRWLSNVLYSTLLNMLNTYVPLAYTVKTTLPNSSSGDLHVLPEELRSLKVLSMSLSFPSWYSATTIDVFEFNKDDPDGSDIDYFLFRTHGEPEMVKVTGVGTDLQGEEAQLTMFFSDNKSNV